MPDDREIASPVISNVKNPPWGTQPDTPGTASAMRHKQFPWTTYTRDYVGATVTPAYPQRMRTTEHLPSGWPFESSHYKSTFRTPQLAYCRHNVQPSSVHRKNNPHAALTDPYQYPDKSYLVWKDNPTLNLPPIRETQSAPNIVQHSKSRFFTTTYNSVFNARPLELPNYKQKTAWKSDRFRPNSKAQTPALQWQTEYTHDYRGARGRPSTTERPYDMSWSNLTMWCLQHSQQFWTAQRPQNSGKEWPALKWARVICLHVYFHVHGKLSSAQSLFQRTCCASHKGIQIRNTVLVLT